MISWSYEIQTLQETLQVVSEMERNQALAMVRALSPSNLDKVSVRVERRSDGALRGIIDPPRLARHHAAALGAAKEELYALLRPPTDEERQTCAQAASGSWNNGVTLRRRYPVCYPFCVLKEGGRRGACDDDAAEAYGALCRALGYQDMLRAERGERAHGRDVYAARAWAFVNEHIADGRWRVDELGFVERVEESEEAA